MLVFGHAGITLGAAAILNGALIERKYPSAWFSALTSRIDVRLLMIGSLLPDIIDKPVGQVFFRQTFNNGRIISHTLLFLVLLTAVGLYFYKRQSQVWLLTLAFGTFMHLILDEMWRIPQTLFWPLLGFTFPAENLSNWLGGLWYALLTDPATIISELVGFLIVLWFGISLLRRRQVVPFLRYGRIKQVD